MTKRRPPAGSPDTRHRTPEVLALTDTPAILAAQGREGYSTPHSEPLKLHPNVTVWLDRIEEYAEKLVGRASSMGLHELERCERIVLRIHTANLQAIDRIIAKESGDDG